LQNWIINLDKDPDKEFLINGLKNGFTLIDTNAEDIAPVTSCNHKSALILKDKVEARLLEEIEDGNYVKTDPNKVRLISPLAAIEKSDGDVRLIHDLSYPAGYSLNDYATKEVCQYETLNETIKTLKPGMWMAKCDLKWAYRSVRLRPDQHALTGLQWTFKGDREPTTLVDTAFCFGARKSPAHFNRITKAVKRMMVRRGFSCSVYLDDFLVSANTFAECTRALKTLVELLRSLGFRINWKKMIDPCQNLVFLGIQIDTVCNTLSLDQTKAEQIASNVSIQKTKRRLSKKQLEKLVGQLSWACNVITWGRAYLASFYQFIRHLKAANHKLRVTPAMLSDLTWWQACLNAPIHRRAIWPSQRQALLISTDACPVAGGAFLHNKGAWIYTNFAIDKPTLANTHINVKELAMIGEAINTWGPLFPGHHIKVQSDNMTSVCCLNKGSARDYHAARIMKDIASTAHTYDISVEGLFIPGAVNDIPDSISRLHSPGQFMRLSTLLSPLHDGGHPTYCLLDHMSALSYIFLLPQVERLLRWWKSWMKK